MSNAHTGHAPLLELRELTKSYSESRQPAVRSVSLVLGRGELLALVGASGCGKTTLLRMIAGFERPDAGEVLVEGTSVARRGLFVPPERRGIGLVFQDATLFPHLTLRRNVAFGIKRKPRREREGIVEDLLCLAGIGELADRYPHEVSGGQAQRAALARALAPGPRVLLLDEPFNSLDPGLKMGLVSDVRELLASTRTAAILVTHERNEAFAFADRIAVMSEGRLLQSGSPEALYRKPQRPEVAAALGRVNLISHWAPDAPLNGHGVTLSDGRLMIRPERLELLRPEEAPPRSALGRVRRVVFCGEHLEVWVSGLAREDLVVRAHPDASFTEGQPVAVRLTAAPAPPGGDDPGNVRKP